MRPRLLAPLPCLLLAASCGARAHAPAAPPDPAAPPASASAAASIPPSPPGSPAQLVHMVTPSRLFPELVGPRGLVATEDGVQRFLVDRMRLLVRADGSMERAAELLPGGEVASIALPSRLGGGCLFHVNAGGGTEIWRATGWLAKLEPLTRRNEVVADVVPGFDRVYLRLATNNRIIALNVRGAGADEWAPGVAYAEGALVRYRGGVYRSLKAHTSLRGATPDAGPATWQDESVMGLGPLPPAAGYGMLAFADGWRAVVDTDLRGPLATFDAGATWRAVGVGERPAGVGVVDGNPAVLVNGGRYLIDPHGGVTYRTDAAPGSPRAAAEADVDRARGDLLGDGRRPSPLGKRPLRAAVEDGWPDSATTAVVARGGALARVSLRDGAVLAIAEDAYPDTRSTCHAVRLGLHGVGFLCGEHEGPTTIYAYAPPLAMKPVLRFEKPRFVAASGNGALVVRGRCASDPAPSDEVDARWYCVRSPTGALREIRVKGFDLGVERVVGLGDGRIAVIVPPRGGSAGALSVISGSATVSVPLELPAEPKETTHEIKRGMWLEGFEERTPGVLGGWVEAGGPVVGIEIGLDGKVKAGELRDEVNGAVYGGRFAVALGEGGHAFETSDGGMTWASFELTERDREARAAPSRGCGPAGCALPGWVRVGWGDTETPDDMKPVESPGAPYVPMKISPTLTFDCSLASVATPPLADRSRGAAPAPPPPPPPSRRWHGPPPAPAGGRTPRDLPTPWSPFRNVEPPPLAPDDYAVDNGPNPNDLVSMHAYAWGKRASDWTRNGRWTIRFDDRFDPAGGVRQTAVTSSLWAHDADAVDAIGTQPTYGSATWTAYLDPSGHALLAAACHQHGGALCSLYSAADGQPLLPIRAPAAIGFLRPYGHGTAVRVGETWFFVTPMPSYEGVALWRADLGVARQIGAYYRPAQRTNPEAPRLTRRAFGTGIGLVVGGAAEPGERSGSWYVIPVDPETGALGEAAALIRRDFARASLAACAPEQDGWLLDLTPDTATNVVIDNAQAQLERAELRVRVDPGRACIESLAVRSGPFHGIDTKGPAKPLTAPPGRKGGGGGDEGTIPLAATENYNGRRWGLTCKLKKR